MKKTPYSLIGSKLVKPHHLFTYSKKAKNSFLSAFDAFSDDKSFFFLQYLIKYCIENNKGEWPTTITTAVVKSISDEVDADFIVEELKIYKDGYLLKNGNDYELTHEFIVLSYISCSDGDSLPISTVHIDVSSSSNQEKIASVLTEHFFINNPQTIKFLLKILADMLKVQGTLINRQFNLEKLLKITMENDLTFETCFESAKESSMVEIGKGFMVTCERLILASYLASPKKLV